MLCGRLASETHTLRLYQQSLAGKPRGTACEVSIDVAWRAVPRRHWRMSRPASVDSSGRGGASLLAEPGQGVIGDHPGFQFTGRVEKIYKTARARVKIDPLLDELTPLVNLPIDLLKAFLPKDK